MVAHSIWQENFDNMTILLKHEHMCEHETDFFILYCMCVAQIGLPPGLAIKSVQFNPEQSST